MGLTVTEKEHWRHRVTQRIDVAIRAASVKDPILLKRISHEAEQLAAKLLGLTALREEQDRFASEAERLDLERHKNVRRQIALTRGCDVNDVEENLYGQYSDQEVTQAILEAKGQFETELLSKDLLGRRILELREEKDRLIDAIWLASSGKQVKELWEPVYKKLVQQPTTLQSAALSIEENDDS